MIYLYTNDVEKYFQIKIKHQIKLILNYEKFKNIKSENKIIVYFTTTEDFDFIKVLSKEAKFVFLLDCEMWIPHIKLMNDCRNLKNVIWARSAILNYDHEFNFLFYGKFFYDMVELYKDIPDIVVEKLNPYKPKPYYFDALLGNKKCHRDFIYKNCSQTNIKEKIILKYCNPDSAEWYKEPNSNYIESILDNNYSSILTEFNGKHCMAAQIIPIKIYNESAYSIIAETGFINDYSYFTEKTAKPLYTKRLFIVFSGKNFLKNLKSLGFKTFDTIIDESYDSIENNEIRWESAFKQVVYLCSLEQEKILEKIKPITEHNHKLLKESNYYFNLSEQIRSLICM